MSSSRAVDDVRKEYQRSLSDLVNSWNRECTGYDTAKLAEVHLRINSLLPEPTFGQDILSGMKTCTPTQPIIATATANCLDMKYTVVLARLKNRVEPQFSQSELSQIKVFPVTIRVKAKISENGEVASFELLGGN